MTAILEAIRSEIEPLEQRLGVLRELETLARQLDPSSSEDGAVEEAEVPPAASARAPRKPRRSAAPADARTARPGPAGVTWAFQQLGRPAIAREVAELVGLREATVASTMRDMVEAGTLVVAGHGERANGNSNGRRPILYAVPEISDAAAASPTRTATTVPLPELKEAIVAHLQARPASEQDLATRLKVDREDVAFAVGELLVDDQVALDPNGTYRATTTAGGGSHNGDNPRTRLVELIKRIGGGVTTTELRFQIAKKDIRVGNLEQTLEELLAEGAVASEPNAAGDAVWSAA